MTIVTQSALDQPGGLVDPETLEQYRRELTGFCYRMLGSGLEAEDAVQEIMLHAVRGGPAFEGRSSVRSWLYRIATNVCIDLLRDRAHRAFPIGLAPPSHPELSSLGPMLPEHTWVTPVASARAMPETGDPAEIAAARESIRLAFVTALQHLPPRQRAVLLLRQVLRFSAAEVAELLGTTPAAVNSALLRARTTLASVRSQDRPAEAAEEHAELLARYVDAFQRYDIAALVSLLHADAVQSMPPFAIWLRGPSDIGSWMLGPGSGCRGSQLLPTEANGRPAFGQYRVDPAGGYAPWSLQVLEISAGRIGGLHFFLDTDRLFPLFALPPHLPA
jgi:RNA polymerase sigma-70 factor (ECF subfamily)